MKKMPLLIFAILIIVISGAVFYTAKKEEPVREDSKQTVQEYTSISSDELESMLADKDFIFIDVHTPEQEHIAGTDFVIPFDQTQKITSVLNNKNTKVVLYCRSGSMSKIAAQTLTDMGYSNVYELIGGLHDWISRGRKTVPIGSIPTP
ncbi:MAG: hypothetical protein A3A97_02765 [Candidatus Terrybacteria bacterium RIFCSPLOWO2_01_FULL_40_23]|uniref:Rhodanese domain-containing protein n=1 Tax=Candidatus Terrybacteria bacterium RIFCSPLOWO2_01_FULL_40_23 TaxID=1802366 RepID=A0A1G2PS39_9BACT|nr:MAG: hypothetical protein A3A97_02765 [Candidatus Terrybacteria bacterium RIFCSPLOWO2_01_FULL_40_23]